MSRFRKLMAIAACLFAMSSVFVACSDDDSTTMGAVPVNSCQVTGTTVNVVWSIVPNEKCGGYEVSLIQGNRDGAVIETKTLDNRTCKASFTGLTPNTRYTIKTQAIPGKGFSAAEPYYREFTTAPLVVPVLDGFTFYTVKGYNAQGEEVVTPYYKAAISWNSLPKTNCGGYRVAIYPKGSSSAVASVSFTPDSDGNTPTSTVFEKLVPATDYTVRAQSLSNSACDYSAGDWSSIDITTPAAPAN